MMPGRYFPPTDLGKRLNAGEPIPAQRPAYAEPPHAGAPDWWLEMYEWPTEEPEGMDHLRSISRDGL
jgi:hypothetical protein